MSDELVERLRADSKPGYGLDLLDSDEEVAAYWSKIALRMRNTSAEAADRIEALTTQLAEAIAKGEG